MNDDEQLIIHLLEAGAKGYLIKNTDADEIKLALHACYQNGYYFSDHVSTVMLKSIMQKSNASPTFNDPKKIVLTERELEVLQMICEGMTASEIGKKIFLSHRTVEGIKATLLEKTNARNTAALIMFAIKNNYC
jgi:DNA-binding NarL/FixJ family response regulator